MSTREEAYRRRQQPCKELVAGALDALQRAVARFAADTTAPSLLPTALKALTLAEAASHAVDEEFAELDRVFQAACDDAKPVPTLGALPTKRANARAALLDAEKAVRAVQQALGLP